MGIENIAKLICDLRKEKALTQGQLAKLLSVSDKAVSKWETGGGYPDISLLPKIAEVFSVSTDYLLTGKEAEKKPVSKFEYCAMNNDFETYEIIKKDNHLFSFWNEDGKELMDYVLEYESTTIFNKLVNEKNFDGWIRYRNNKLVFNDQIIKLAIISNSIDFLQKYKIVRNGYNIDPNSHKTEHLDNISKTMFQDNRVQFSTLTYLLGLDNGTSNFGLLSNFMLDAIKYGNDSIAEKLIQKALEINTEAAFKYNELQRKDSIWVQSNAKLFASGLITERNGHPYCRFVEIGKVAFDEAIELQKYELVAEMNKVNELFAPRKAYIIEEKGVDLLKMKSNPNVSDDEVLVYNYMKSSLLDVNGLLNSILTNVDDVSVLKANLKRAKTIYSKFIVKSYIHYCEMIEDLLSKKDYKELFKFSVDNELTEMTDALMNRQHDSIMSVAKRLFNLDLQTKTNSIHRKNSKYIDILKNQYPIDGNNIESFFDICSMKKKEIYENFVSNIESKIEKITGEKKTKLEYERVCEEISENYINLLITSNQLETAVIKLCVKLESKLKYIFKYEGEFKTMLDSYIQNNLKLDNLWDDEDNNYYSSKQRDAKKVEVTKLLNKLRMVRNGIVHSTSQQEMLSLDELNNIVEIIEKM